MNFFISIVLCILMVRVACDDYEVIKTDLNVPNDPKTWRFKALSIAAEEGRDGRLSGGLPAISILFPWVAELRIQTTPTDGLLCTGSLISDKWILSARQCIAGVGAIAVQVNLGSTNRTKPLVTVFSDQFVWLGSATGENHPDVAMFRLAQAVTFSLFVSPIRLPAKSESAAKYEGQVLTAAGWGEIGNGKYSYLLQWSVFRVLPIATQCNFGLFQTGMYLCSEQPLGTSSFEDGDSGGPSVVFDKFTPTLAGINSFHATVNGERYQGSTKVSLYLDIISQVTGIPIRS